MTAVVGSEATMATLNASVDLPPTAVAPGAARHALRELLRAWRAPHPRIDAELLVTELVTNAVEHAGGEHSLLLQVGLSDGWLRVSLADGSAMRPVLRALYGQQPRGRGVRLISTLAARWGCEDYHGGKCVWFELAAPTAQDELSPR